MWRDKRIQRLEKGLLEHMESQVGLYDIEYEETEIVDIKDILKPRMIKSKNKRSENKMIQLKAQKIMEKPEYYELLLRYDTTISRQLMKAIESLLYLQDIGKNRNA